MWLLIVLRVCHHLAKTVVAHHRHARRVAPHPKIPDRFGLRLLVGPRADKDLAALRTAIGPLLCHGRPVMVTGSCANVEGAGLVRFVSATIKRARCTARCRADASARSVSVGE